MSGKPQDADIVKFGQRFASDMTKSKHPDPATYQSRAGLDQVLDAVLRGINPELADAESRNDMSSNYPGLKGYVFYFKRVKDGDSWAWKFTEYVET